MSFNHSDIVSCYEALCVLNTDRKVNKALYQTCVQPAFMLVSNNYFDHRKSQKMEILNDMMWRCLSSGPSDGGV